MTTEELAAAVQQVNAALQRYNIDPDDLGRQFRKAQAEQRRDLEAGARLLEERRRYLRRRRAMGRA